ncbi:MAG: glycoside hydrolase family 65 protein [Bacteroidetes bacterium]|nr:MAG: glycoside hydrolase family 65 protein [Bacteroidota bacterium]
MKNNWTVTYKGFDKKEHPLREALCTLGNGYFATRGALEMERNKFRKNGPGKEWNYPGTYLACGFNRMKSKVEDRVIENEDLVNWPNWLFLTFKIDDGDWFDMDNLEILDYRTDLKLKEGILERSIKFRDKKGRETSLFSRRLVSMDNPHAAAIHWELTPENWSGEITLRSGIDGDIINNNVERYSDLNQDHIEVLNSGHFNESSVFLQSHTKQSNILVAQAARTQIFSGEELLRIEQKKIKKNNFVAGDFLISCSEGQTVTIEKIASFYTSRDMAISDPLTEARKLIDRVKGFAQLEQAHTTHWDQLWQFNDIELKTNESLDQLVTRLHIFHLYQTVSYNSIDYDIGIPARGWHGEAYRGHIFWDELYIQPFIDLHHPQLSRSLLMYRYRRLTEARYAAKEAGFRGAMFPWQSGSNGREETQKMHLNPESGRWLPDVSHLQYHINAAIPYNVWHYYQSTGDMDFLLSHGAEIILSTALFWSSIAEYNKEKGNYEIRKVMGPDEYHTHYPDAPENEPGLNNNAYTNVMAVWVIQHALDLLELLDENCCKNLQESIGFTEKDTERWEDITKKMYVPFQDNIILQFDGYEKLKELDWDHYHEKHGHSLRLDRILEAEGDSCNNYKASKQADVLMLFYLFSSEELSAIFEKLGYNFSPEYIPENIEYYRKRTAHGSTLSQVIHAWVYARSHRNESWKRFRKALMSDFKDVQGGTTHEGIHLGAMAGTLDLIQRCYSGLEIRDDVLWFNPQLPDDIEEMNFNLRYRGHWMDLKINHKKLTIDFDKGWANPVTIGVKGEKHLFKTNDKKIFNLK